MSRYRSLQLERQAIHSIVYAYIAAIVTLSSAIVMYECPRVRRDISQTCCGRTVGRTPTQPRGIDVQF